MGMMRQADFVEQASGAVVLDLGDLARQAEALKQAAQVKARQIIANAQAERSRLLEGAEKRGYDDGFASGREEGLREGTAEGRKEGREQAFTEIADQLSTVQESWTASLTEFEHARRVMLAEARDEVLALALAIAERATKRIVEVDSQVAVAQVAAALETLMAPSKLTISVNPEDFPLLTQAMPELADRFESASEATLMPDPALARGSCVVSSAGGGMVHASVEDELRSIVDELVPVRGSAGAAGHTGTALKASEPTPPSDEHPESRAA